ncbi:MAG: S46 family peptidase [Rhodanobacteraceae bacterium]|nr:S46 family peptidase [Rhodanobacteraceae bacterium]
MKTLTFAIAALLAATPALALDGKWTPEQVLEIDPAWLKEQGLELPPSALWDAARGTGLLVGTVNLAGCSGAFVSATGLIVTNHHCLFPLLQEHSTPARDLIRDGFLARKLSEELSGTTIRVDIPRRFTDVSERVLASVPADADPLQRLAAIDVRQKELVAECQKQPDTKCKVAVYDEGLKYTLIESTELRDVRLVYAPPRAIGEYGGEIDNWMWPRHTGDFAIARAWAAADGKPADRSADNRPYQPEFYFPIARDSLAVGDFVMLLGYPGITWRALIAEEMKERRERFFVRREDVFGEWIAHLEQASAGDAAGEIAVAANVKGINNRYKNAQGQIAGLDRGRIVARQMAADDAVAAFAAEHDEHADALTARRTLRQLLAERERSWERDFLLNLIPMGIESVPGGIPPLPKSLYFGATLAHHAREQAKADTERAAGFTSAELPQLRDRMRREQQNYFPAADRRVFAALVRRALALPKDQRIAAVDAHFGQIDSNDLDAAIARMYAATPLLDADAREQMLAEDLPSLQARKDPLLDFAIDWDEDLRALRQRERDWASRSAIARPIWRRAVQAHAGKPIAPDANSTLRVSFAHVQGYAPRDGVQYTPFTTLAGLLEKHTGAEPFALPEALRTAAREPGTHWIEPALGDVPVNFLADGDSSGGNSGSPVVNGKGELVGINFDRVWENVAGDFGFNPALSRNISVDVRYLLWLLQRVERADELLQELGVEAEPEAPKP